jgi:phosphoribosylformimino-5-aminoimidazole carboxamide ribotide isomerase
LQIIPVIDLLNGRAVHARAGQRDRYAPVSSPLCPDGDPLRLAEAYLGLFPFPTLYVADLDAILGRGSNRAVLTALRDRWPDCTLWVDAGVLSRSLDLPGARPVFGSESGGIADGPREPQPVLSLDFSAAGFIGDAGLLERPDSWPTDVVVMTLARVGMRAGPDLETASRVRRVAGDHRLYLGGGVRSAGDLERACAIGMDGALVATALHEGVLSPDVIAALQG